MKTKIAALVLALAAAGAAGPAYAGDKDIEELAQYTGLSERKVQMVLGCHTCYAGYAYTYQRSLEKFQAALGEENYERLMSGELVKLDNGAEVQVHVAMVDRR